LGEDGSYIDPWTEIPYTSDKEFIETGVNQDISPVFNSDQPAWVRTVRSFPDGNRASFMYGNYDINLWDSLKLDNASHVVNKEIIHVPSLDHLYICLLNTGFGTPFISALQVRHFHNYTYCDKCTTINTSMTTDSLNRTDFNLPPKVMMTASLPLDVDEPLSFDLDTGEATLDFTIYMHFAELEILEDGQSRVFDISLNGISLRTNVTPSYLHSTTVSSPHPVRGSKLSFLLTKSLNSTHPPILNSMEIYIVNTFWQSPTHQGDGNY
ncbi:Putative leucine-rich repeat receptor-like protein kinase At2g19210, partial [Linum perenne]